MAEALAPQNGNICANIPSYSKRVYATSSVIEDIEEPKWEVTNLLRIIGGVSDVPIISRGPKGMIRCTGLQKDGQLTVPSSEDTKDE